jgi:hypothetical protein
VAAHRIEHQVEGKLLKIQLSGPFEANRAQPIIEEVWGLVQNSGAQLLLVDVCQLEGRVSLSQTFFNIRSYPTAGAALRTAIVELPENMEQANFHDTAASNMGFNIRHFTEEKEALAWLRGEPAPIA